MPQDYIDVYSSSNDPTTITWTDYDALLYWSNSTPDRIAWGNAIVSFINDGGGVVDGVFELQSSQSTFLQGDYTDDYQVVVRGDVQYGDGGTMDSVLMPGHPIMENVSSVRVTDYTADLTVLQTNSYTIAKYTDSRILAAARESVGTSGARRVSLNLFPPGLDFDDTTDVGTLIANSLIWVSNLEITGEQKAVVGIADTISFNIMENDTIVQWYKKTEGGDWAEYGDLDTNLIEIYNEPDTIYYKIDYIRDIDTITSNPFKVVAKYAQTIDLPSLSGLALDQEDYDPEASASSELSVIYTTSNASIANIIESKIHPVMVGSCIIYVNQAGDMDYWPAMEVFDTLIVKATSQTITFDALTDKTYGDVDFDAGAIASSGFDITYSSSDTTIVSIVEGNIHIKTAGSCSIYADQPGNDTLLAAEQVEQVLQINQATAEVTITDTVYSYDGTAQSVTTTTDPSELSVTVTYDGSEIIPTDAGSYAVVATIDEPNYEGSETSTLVIEKAMLSVVISDTVHSYDGTARSVTTTTDPSELSVTVTYDGSEIIPTDAGSYAVVATIDEPNYEGSETSTLVIEKAMAGIGISDTTHSYDGTAKPVTVVTDPIGLNVVVSYDGNETIPSDGGTYTVIATVEDVNYMGADTTSLVITEVTNNITNSSTPTMVVFPNPIVNTLNIEVSNDLIRDVSIYSITGKQVFEQNYSTHFTQLDFTQFNSGVYFVKVKTNNGEFIEKVIK